MLSLDTINSDILELETQHDTTWSTCQRLAWLYVVRDHITGQAQKQPVPLEVSGDSDFLRAVDGRDSVKAWAIIDELMETIKILQPRVYDSVLRRLAEI
nr:MAG TPA: hypothetical protein [Caudoviricetes sp.]